MFVYQNANRDICVTFSSRMPVKNPEYVISIDHENGIIMVNGEEMVPAASAEEDTTEPEVTETEEPEQEEPAEPSVLENEEDEIEE